MVMMKANRKKRRKKVILLGSFSIYSKTFILATVSKAKLFKIRSNSSLEPNETITEYEQEPFFEDK